MKSLASAVAFTTRHRVGSAIALLLVLPWVLPYEALAVNILIFGLYAVGFNLLFGYTGLLSFGHAAFLGTGSYLCGMGIVHLGLPWWAAIALGVVSATLAGALIGLLAIRTRGIYFSMVTLALGQIVYYAFYKAEGWTGGENGLRGVRVEKIHLLGLEIDFVHPLTKYYVVLVFVAAALWFISRVLASPFGAVIEAVRENEQRAAACGFDVARTKLLAFTLSAGVCGLAGTLRALHLSVVPIDSLHYLQSGQAVMMCLLGGMGTFFGPFVGAAVFLVLEDVVTQLTPYWMAVVGTVFMVFVLFFPRGIWGSILHWLARAAARKAARS
ncbi:MAG: branched-chain amino acid ABC transporter permease [Ideonella sp.]|nr:branched-chain amino acid ABC transporter permease [Ideonella sp.]